MNNIEKCKKLTQERDWAGLFELNGLEIDSFGTKKELSVLGDYLQKDEVVFALVSGMISQSETSTDFGFGAKNWITALTSERIRESFHNLKLQLTSILEQLEQKIGSQRLLASVYCA